MNSKYKGICKGLAKVVLVLGIIGSIVLAALCGEVKDVSYSIYSGVSTKMERDVVLTIVYFVSGVFGTVILYTILAGLGEALEYLEEQSKKKIKDIISVDKSEEELPPL